MGKLREKIKSNKYQIIVYLYAITLYLINYSHKLHTKVRTAKQAIYIKKQDIVRMTFYLGAFA
jgi:hypothetical protein